MRSRQADELEARLDTRYAAGLSREGGRYSSLDHRRQIQPQLWRAHRTVSRKASADSSGAWAKETATVIESLMGDFRGSDKAETT